MRARRLWKSRAVEKSKKRTFPQPLRRAFGYIFDVSIAMLKVTFSNVLTRPSETENRFANRIRELIMLGQSLQRLGTCGTATQRQYQVGKNFRWPNDCSQFAR